jgi:hypothetical protein
LISIKADGKATVLEGPQQGGNIALEVCIAPEALARLVTDHKLPCIIFILFSYHIGWVSVNGDGSPSDGLSRRRP